MDLPTQSYLSLLLNYDSLTPFGQKILDSTATLNAINVSHNHQPTQSKLNKSVILLMLQEPTQHWLM